MQRAGGQRCRAPRRSSCNVRRSSEKRWPRCDRSSSRAPLRRRKRSAPSPRGARTSRSRSRCVGHERDALAAVRVAARGDAQPLARHDSLPAVDDHDPAAERERAWRDRRRGQRGVGGTVLAVRPAPPPQPARPSTSRTQGNTRRTLRWYADEGTPTAPATIGGGDSCRQGQAGRRPRHEGGRQGPCPGAAPRALRAAEGREGGRRRRARGPAARAQAPPRGRARRTARAAATSWPTAEEAEAELIERLPARPSCRDDELDALVARGDRRDRRASSRSDMGKVIRHVMAAGRRPRRRQARVAPR